MTTETLHPVEIAATKAITERLSRAVRQASTARREADSGLPQFAARDLALATDSLSSALWLMDRHDVCSDGSQDESFAIATARIAEAALALSRVCATN